MNIALPIYLYNGELVRVEPSGEDHYAVHFLAPDLTTREVAFVSREDFDRDATAKIDAPAWTAEDEAFAAQLTGS